MGPLRFWLREMNIGRRLAGAFAALILFMILVGGIAFHQLSHLSDQTRLLFDHPYAVTDALDEVDINALKIQAEMKDVAHGEDVHDLREHAALMQEYESRVLQSLQTVKDHYLGDPAQVESLENTIREWTAIRQKVLDLRAAGDYEAAHAVVRGEHADYIDRMRAELEALKDHADQRAAEALAHTDQIMHEALILVVLMLAALTLLAALIAVAITRSIRLPLGRLDAGAAEVSKGNLRYRVPIESRDELGRLARAFNEMVGNIEVQEEEIRRKNEENEALLLNILPAPIAERLKQGESTIADQVPEVTVLFADLVDFTSLSEAYTPDELVTILNELFSEFDDAAKRLGIEKIKTIGDAYMAVSGLVTESDDQAGAMVALGLEMIAAVERINKARGTSFALRVGINLGPVVAGVIGRTKFIYDLWGDTVNLASRMESHGVVGRIQVTEAVYQRIKGRFPVEERGVIDIKGKGEMVTYLIGSAAKEDAA